MHPQQHVLKRLDEAYKRFFKKAGGFPSFKRYGNDPGIRFPDPKQFELDGINGRLKIPKLGWLRLRLSQQIEGELRNVSLGREGDRWFVSIQTRQAACQPAAGLQLTLGIDLGITNFAATSDARFIEPLQALKAQQQRLRRYQKSVSRKIKGSCNRKKAVVRLGNLHRRIARQRADWLHKLSTELASQHPVIAIEDLKVKNMSASASGRGRKAKSGLNRSILDAAWAEFRRQLDYKVQANGGQLIAVHRAYTSQTCSACGHCSSENRKSQSLFACVACGHTAHADINAAMNILAAGHAASACGEVIRHCSAAKQLNAASVKQEPAKAFNTTQEVECV